MRRILLMIIILFFALSHNIEAKALEREKSISISQPVEKSFSTDKKLCFINGKAESGKVLEIKIYSAMDLKGKYDLLNLPLEDEWIEVSSEEITVGKLGIFDKQLDLVSGINKVVIKSEKEEDIVIFILVREKTVKIQDLIPNKVVAIEKVE